MTEHSGAEALGRQSQAGFLKFKTRLVYQVSSRTAKAVKQRNPVMTEKKKGKKKKGRKEMKNGVYEYYTCFIYSNRKKDFSSGPILKLQLLSSKFSNIIRLCDKASFPLSVSLEDRCSYNKLCSYHHFSWTLPSPPLEAISMLFFAHIFCSIITWLLKINQGIRMNHVHL